MKTLGVWAQVPDDRMRARAEPRARTPLEHMLHQCLSEEGWMRTMLGIDAGGDVLPPEETRDLLIAHYAGASARRLAMLEQQPESWFEAEVPFFEVRRSRAWVLTRRVLHSAHHRGQLNAAIRSWGLPLYSTYGPTADTGGLPKNGARTIYLFDDATTDAKGPATISTLPGAGGLPVTERPDPNER